MLLTDSENEQSPTSRRRNRVFNMDDEKLIILVQNNECLFNLCRKDYSDNNLKTRLWKEIGEELGFSGK